MPFQGLQGLKQGEGPDYAGHTERPPEADRAKELHINPSDSHSSVLEANWKDENTQQTGAPEVDQKSWSWLWFAVVGLIHYSSLNPGIDHHI